MNETYEAAKLEVTTILRCVCVVLQAICTCGIYQLLTHVLLFAIYVCVGYKHENTCFYK